jgi:hypothetical protein
LEITFKNSNNDIKNTILGTNETGGLVRTGVVNSFEFSKELTDDISFSLQTKQESTFSIIKFKVSRSISVFRGKVEIKKTGFLSENIEDQLLSDPYCGNHAFLSKTSEFYLVLTSEANCIIKLSLKEAIVTSVKFNIDYNEFIEKDGIAKVLSFMKSTLGLPQNSDKVKILEIQRGSTIVLFSIENDKKIEDLEDEYCSIHQKVEESDPFSDFKMEGTIGTIKYFAEEVEGKTNVLPCNPTPYNSLCKNKDEDNITCIECNSGFWLDSVKNECNNITLVDNCEEYSINRNACEKCQNNFYKESDRNCLRYDSNLICKEFNPTANECLSCFINADLTDQKKCELTEKCQEFVQNSTDCLVCKPAYYLNPESKICSLRNAKNCKTFKENADECEECLDNHWIDFKNGNTCVPYTPVENCLVFNGDSDSCKRCKSGFNLIDNKCIDPDGDKEPLVLDTTAIVIIVLIGVVVFIMIILIINICCMKAICCSPEKLPVRVIDNSNQSALRKKNLENEENKKVELKKKVIGSENENLILNLHGDEDRIVVRGNKNGKTPIKLIGKGIGDK